MPDGEAVLRSQLRVSGVGRVEAAPDHCLLHLALIATAATTAEALARVSQLANQVLVVLRHEGIREDDVRTTNVLLHDRVSHPDRRVTGRSASYELRIATSELEQAGHLVSALAAVAGESLTVRSVELTVKDPRPLEGTARRMAVLDAQSKASELAAAAGVRLRSLVSIEEVANSRPHGLPVASARFNPMATGQPVIPPAPIEAGSFTVTSSVLLVYAISEQ